MAGGGAIGLFLSTPFFTTFLPKSEPRVFPQQAEEREAAGGTLGWGLFFLFGERGAGTEARATGCGAAVRGSSETRRAAATRSGSRLGTSPRLMKCQSLGGEGWQGGSGRGREPGGGVGGGREGGQWDKTLPDTHRLKTFAGHFIRNAQARAVRPRGDCRKGSVAPTSRPIVTSDPRLQPGLFMAPGLRNT